MTMEMPTNLTQGSVAPETPIEAIVTREDLPRRAASGEPGRQRRQPRPIRARRADERGSGTVLMMSVMLITAMVAFVAACLISWFGCIHQTRTAADLAALAGAGAFDAGSDPCASAGATAASNHTTMTACNVATNGVDVVIRVTVQIDAKPAVAFGPRQFNYTSEAGHIG